MRLVLLTGCALLGCMALVVQADPPAPSADGWSAMSNVQKQPAARARVAGEGPTLTAINACPRVPVVGQPRTVDTSNPAAVAPAPLEGGSRYCLPCPSDACWGQQAAGPDEPWSAYTSSNIFPYLVAENYDALDCNAICDVHWWGLSLLWGPGWYLCDPAGMVFEIKFYPPGPEPGDPVCTYTVTPSISYAGDYGGYPVWYFVVPRLTPCCQQTQGWITIQSVASPNNCAFLWLSACPGEGDGVGLQRYSDGAWQNVGVDFAVCFTECQIECQPGAIPEGEPVCYDGYIDNYNGGCNSTPYTFQPIACGQTVCGTSGVYNQGGFRDTDWYELVLLEPTIVTWKAIAEFDTLIFIITPGPPPDPCASISYVYAYGPPCTPVSLTQCLPPGTYWLWIGPADWDPLPCGTEYVAQVSCTPCVTDPELGHFSAWAEWLDPLYPGENNDGWGVEYGGPWFRYPQWWNQWWPNEWDMQRNKRVRLEFDVMTWNAGWVAVAFDWSREDWQDPYYPPHMSQDEFVMRHMVGEFTQDGHYVVDMVIPYCPPWVSVDVFGERYWIEGTIRHHCFRPCTPDFVVTAPGQWSGNTCGAGNDCDLRPSEDHIYEVTIPTSGRWTFDLCQANWDTYLYIGTTCCGAEIGQNDDYPCYGNPTLQSLYTAYLEPGVYWVTVEGYWSGACGPYTLAIYKECADFIVTAPGTWHGDTCQEGNDCPLRPSEDEIWNVYIPHPGIWTFATCGANFDTYMYVGTACCTPDIGQNDDAVCFGVGSLQSKLRANIPAAGWYWVMIEAYSPGQCGQYPLSIYMLGDANCDGLVNNFDITPFVLALTDLPQYMATYGCLENCDCNEDGAVNNFDITPFVYVLTH